MKDMEELSKKDLSLVEGGHIGADTSLGHDVGYIVGLSFRYSVAGFILYELF